MDGRLVERHFRVLVLCLCTGFLLLQARYIWGLPLVMDEFANAGHVARVTQGVPYRDYVPYKTIGGYCLLAPAIAGFGSIWAAMLAAKLEIAAITTAVLAAAALRLRRHFGAAAVLGSLLLLVTQSTFLERASELRVDMLAALFGLASLIAYLESRAVLAGALAGAAILATQKGAYYVVALGGAALVQWLRRPTRSGLLELLKVGASASLVLGVYVGIWSWIGSIDNVWKSMVVGPQRIAFQPLYSLNRFWLQTLERNPVFYGLGAAGLVLLAPRAWREDGVRPRLWTYALILTGLCIWHKQPWPYFFVMLIPTVWVAGAAALDRQQAFPRWWLASLAALVGGAALVSLAQRVPVVLERSSTGQRRVVEAAAAFLAPGDTYLAGTELLWRHRHMAELFWLDAPHIAAVRQDPSLALAELRRAPPRLVIDNYRIDLLPEALRRELNQSHAAVGGNLHTYAPELPEGPSQQSFAYGGLYRVVSPKGGRVRIDGGAWLSAGDALELPAGSHGVEVVAGARLVSWSENAAFVAQTSRPLIHFFNEVYTY